MAVLRDGAPAHAPKLPRWANGERAMTPGEFVYGRPATVGPYITVSSDALKALLDRVYELESLEFAVEQRLRVEVAADGVASVSTCDEQHRT